MRVFLLNFASIIASFFKSNNYNIHCIYLQMDKPKNNLPVLIWEYKIQCPEIQILIWV